MQNNVAKSLGYSGGSVAGDRNTTQTVACDVCKTTLDFDTDDIGRLVEFCPRGCIRRRVAPTPQISEAIGRARRSRHGSGPREVADEQAAWYLHASAVASEVLREPQVPG